MTKKEITQLLAILKANYPNVKIDNAEATLNAWAMQVGEFSADAVYKAARLHMSASPFFPTPADIRNKIVRASIVYPDTPSALALESGGKALTVTEEEEAYLDNICRFVGLGYANDIEGEPDKEATQ